MGKRKSKLELAQEEAQSSINKANEKIQELGTYTNRLYVELNDIQELFDRIRNVPNEKKLQYEELKKIRLNWKQQAEKIENDYKAATVKNAGTAAAGVGLGAAVAAMGPTAAMGIATTFGVASTGTAISTLSGAAATNAALAWLGGGALAAGGGGMAAGNAILALAGPIGWAIAGVALLSGGLLFWKAKCDKTHIEDIFTLISKRDVKSYDLAIVELNERIARINDESAKLNDAVHKINTFGIDYNKMSEAQQYELGAYVNLMSSSTRLLVNAIQGLQPKYSENDLNDFVGWKDRKSDTSICLDYKELIIGLSNFLYKIELNDRDKKLLWKSFRKNKKMLESLNIKKKDFKIEILGVVCEALEYKYSQSILQQH